MSRNSIVILLGMLLTFGVVSESVHAFGIPGVRKRKDDDKKKKDKKKDKKEEKKTDEKKAEKSEDGSKQEAAASTEIPTHTMSVDKKTWEAYANGKVGDYVVYSYPQVPGMTVKQEIVQADDKSITILSTSKTGGQTSKSKTVYKFDGSTKTVEESVKVGDKNVKAVRTEVYADGKLTARSWSSKEVPLGGIVKTEDGNGKASMVLTDFKKN